MTTETKPPWLKIIGWAALIHVILIILSVMEVLIYSTLINPGNDRAFYEAHAKESAPYVAIILGFIILFLVVRYIAKKRPAIGVKVGLWLAASYILFDVILLQASGVVWAEHYIVFIISFSTKLLAGYIGGRIAGN